MTKTRPKESAAPIRADGTAPATPLPIGAARYYNRELSWLQFNRRVLEEAQNLPPSAAGAAALPVDLGVQPRRVLHGARGGPLRPARRRRGAASQDGLTPAQQLTEINRFAADLVSDQQALLDGAQGGAGHRRHRHRRAEGAAARREDLAGAAVPRPPPAGPHAHRRRPGASVPVHPEPRAHRRRGAAARARRQDHARAAADPEPAGALHQAAAGRDRAGRRQPPSGSSASSRRSACSSPSCSPASSRAARAPSACCATATSRCRRRPRIWSRSTRRRSSAAAAAT